MRINRDDMLELTRRMTPSRTCFTRVAGCYVDADGDFDGSFNIHFGKLNAHDREQNLAWAKTIPFASTNEQLCQYPIAPGKNPTQSVWALLMKCVIPYLPADIVKMALALVLAPRVAKAVKA